MKYNYQSFSPFRQIFLGSQIVIGRLLGEHGFRAQEASCLMPPSPCRCSCLWTRVPSSPGQCQRSAARSCCFTSASDGRSQSMCQHRSPVSSEPAWAPSPCVGLLASALTHDVSYCLMFKGLSYFHSQGGDSSVSLPIPAYTYDKPVVLCYMYEGITVCSSVF